MIIERCLRNSFGEIVVISLINYLSLATATWDGTYYRECEYPELQALFAFNGDVASKKKENRLSEMNHVDFSLSLPSTDDGTLHEDGAKIEVESKQRPWMRSAYMEHEDVQVPTGHVHKEVPTKFVEKSNRKEASDKIFYDENHDNTHFQKSLHNPRSESFDVRPKDEGFKEEITQQFNRNERFDEPDLHFRNQKFGVSSSSDVYKSREELAQSTNGLLTPPPPTYRQYTADGKELKATATDPQNWPIPVKTMHPKHTTRENEEIVEKSDLIARYPLKLLPQEKKSMNSEKDQPRPNEMKMESKRRNEAVVSSTTNNNQLVPDSYPNLHAKNEEISNKDFGQSSNARRNQMAPSKSKVVLKRQYKEYIPEPHYSESAINCDNLLNQDGPNWNTDLENPTFFVHSAKVGPARRRNSRQNVMTGRKKGSKNYHPGYPLDLRSRYQYDNYVPRRSRVHRRKTGREFNAKHKNFSVDSTRKNYYSEEEKKLTRSQYPDNIATDFQSNERVLKPKNYENPKEEILFVLNNGEDYP